MRIVVVGDLLLDRDIDGPSTRLSPDGFVPVVDVDRHSVRAGGAGLVARLLAADGHDVSLVSSLSGDRPADELRRSLADIDLVTSRLGSPTPVKVRIFASGQPVVRFDEGCAPAPPPPVTSSMISAIRAADAIVVADYGRGLCSDPDLRTALRQQAHRVPLVWDPHRNGADPVPDTTVATPNLEEALDGATLEEGNRLQAAQAAAVLRDRWRTAAVAVTLGSDGVWVQEEPDPKNGRRIPAPAIGNIDSCGAGDRFAGCLAAALVGSDNLPAAVEKAVRRTASFLAAGGVQSIPDQPKPPMRPGLGVIERVRAAGGTVVATGGCFDLLHAGHLRTLRAARAHGDALIVCLNSDESVARLKGPGRPLISQEDRVELLRALDCVDAVVVFNEDTPLQILEQLQPDIWVKGGDYLAEMLPEQSLISTWGGRCVTVPFHLGRSTTSMVAVLESSF